MCNDGLGTGCERTVGVCEQVTVLISQEETRGNSIHTKTLAKLHSQLAAHILRPVDHRSLRHAIARNTCQRTQSRLRGDVDNRATALRNHSLDKNHRRQDSAKEVQIHHLTHRLNVEIEDRLIGRNGSRCLIAASAIDEHVDTAVCLHDSVIATLQRRLVQHVALQEQSLTTRLAGSLLQTFTRLAVTTHYHHSSPLRCKVLDHRRSENTRSTRDGDNSIFYAK